ncbi:conserved hypothetical protein [Talaromyces stipitatus ATCC 10500]|uniref:Zn(2)-C6 fungal-type domain-containing protein n=1 Tax=Talaromyces stipitatus (strain ATCC 10500 / CBS 375.48 / QM 6759 / NRRL 1006) TaxID=441959 RepID=B8MP58_TALSN|nr:uncharacterized protein TSTA_105090 [Talaromyces stipitatus ATCC 10500]EED14297.1 conserved hypothetical protein [Talaromyces stipitatus ATCC 10500]
MNTADRQIVYKDNKRNRRPTSCEQCRIRKAKCNRDLPCEACIKRGEKSACKYASNAIRNPKRRKSNVGERLRRVEKLVSELVGEPNLDDRVLDSQGDGIVNSSRERFATRNDHIYAHESASERETQPRVSKKARAHIEKAHWLSILDDIKEVREELAQSEIMTSPEENEDIIEQEEEIDLVLGPTQKLPTFQNIINSLPSRPICDTLLSQYFNAPMILPIIHAIKFQNEYEKFWHNPLNAPPLWVGLLFSILALTASVHQVIKPPMADAQPSLAVKPLRSRTVQCLIMGNYTRAKSYALETLVMHLLSGYIGKPDSSFDGWFLMGTIIRLAMRMGYHRDPATQAGITPFEGEMRRRRWHAMLQLDTLLSFQMGMPSMIPPEFCDTEPPRNLNDEDIWPNMETLPPSRPLSDYTPILYTIAKSSIMSMFRKVLAHTHQSSSSYAITIDVDTRLRETYTSLPPLLKSRPIAQSFTISSGLILSRITIELLYLKAIIVLHRRYLNTERQNPHREFSRRACINAAMEVLSRQKEVHEATSWLHGRLYADRWMVSSLTAHDFLLADVVVCLELSVMRSTTMAVGTLEGRNTAGFETLLDALLDSQRIWEEKSVDSNEARTAAAMLKLMIDKVKGNTVPVGERNVTKGHDNQPATESYSTSTTMSAPTELEMDVATDFPFADTMTDMITGSEELDWALLDHYLQNTNTALPSPGGHASHAAGGLDNSFDEWGLLDYSHMEMNMNMGMDIGFGTGVDGTEGQHYQGYFG